MGERMKGYFDVHCHLLPDIDDGAKSSEEMMEMIKVAYEEGIRYIFATPHYHPKRGEADAQVIRNVFDKAKVLIEETYPDVRIYDGNEVYYRQDMTDMLKAGKLLTLAGSDYVLVEFSTTVEKSQVSGAVRQLQMAGYLPVIAHVERYEKLVNDYKFIEELADAGVYFQVNASSVLGEAGGAVKRFVKKMIKKEWVHFVGTDAHGSKQRAPLMEKCASYIKKKFGEETALILLYYNPAMVVKNKVI